MKKIFVVSSYLLISFLVIFLYLNNYFNQPPTNSVVEKSITLIEGWTLKDMAEYLEKEGIVSSIDFLTAAEQDFSLEYDFLLEKPKSLSLEGFLFPDTYRFFVNTSAEIVIRKMLDNFNRKLSPELRMEIAQKKKNIFEIITLASVVEKESRNQEEMPKIASVFLNRLKLGLPLQSDATINYITSKKDRQAKLADTKIDSPYNTYLYSGLPAGPIANPGLAAIKAVIKPQKTDDLYFLHPLEGPTIFSKTLEEHNRNKTKYLNNKPLNFVPGELLVKYKNNPEIHKVYFNPKENIEEIIKKYLDNNLIESVEPNYLFRFSLMPNDPLAGEQWFLNKIGAYQAWDIVPGGSEEVVIAVLDSGVDINHPDLKQNIWVNHREIPNDRIDNDLNGYIDDLNGWDFIENVSDPKPKFSSSYSSAGIHHGTVVAGIIGAVGNNNQGIIGIAWRVKIMPLRVLNSLGEGNLEAVVKAIDYAVKNKAQIINLSFVGANKSSLLLEALKKAWQANILVVAAAGNDTINNGNDLDQNPLYPICSDKEEKENIVLGVAAVNENDQKARFSNFGQSCIDLAAPGTKIFSSLFYSSEKEEFKEYYGGYWSGTSVAAPIVSATAALIKSMNVNLTPREIREIILSQSDEINHLNQNYQSKLGQGRINTYKAVLEVYNRSQIYADSFIVTGAGQGGGPQVRIFKPDSLVTGGFFAYHKNFRGGISLATGDFDGDGRKEIVTGAGQGGGPQVRIFDSEGKVKGQFFAYHEKFRGGINVAAGDLNRDGFDEIIVAPQKESLPIRVFNASGYLLVSFYPYHKNFRGGISLATGDFDGDGRKEIVTGAGQGGGPQVRIFDSEGKVKGQFFAYHEKFRGGINVATGDLNQDGFDEIIVSVASEASPYVRIFDYSYYSLVLKAQFLAYDKDFHKGVSLAIGDLDNDGLGEIVTSPFQGGGPQVRIFDQWGKVRGQFFAYHQNFRGGLRVAILKINH